MANQWLRLWHDMVNDPKWRTIAKASKQKIGDVIAVYVHMMTCASMASERGSTEGWNDEDVATALDIETEQVEAIRLAMQGRVLDGAHLTGWEKRQPKRERDDDSSTERSRVFRAKQEKEKPCNSMQRHATPKEATQRLDKDKDEIREDKKNNLKPKTEAPQRASRLCTDWVAPDEFLDFCKLERPDLDPIWMQNKFRDFWVGVPGRQGLKLDWFATWRNFVRGERAIPQPRASPKPEKFDPLAYVNRNRNQRDERTIDINEFGEPV